MDTASKIPEYKTSSISLCTNSITLKAQSGSAKITLLHLRRPERIIVPQYGSKPRKVVTNPDEISSTSEDENNEIKLAQRYSYTD